MKKRRKHKSIKCPLCGSRLIDADVGITAITMRAEESLRADFYSKCYKCKNEIGIRKES